MPNIMVFFTAIIMMAVFQIFCWALSARVSTRQR
jgi:hypothetical protein